MAVIKAVLLIGMFLMHTRVRFKLQFLEFEETNETGALSGSPAGFGTPASYPSPALGNSPPNGTHGYAEAYSPSPFSSGAVGRGAHALDP